MLNRDSEHTKQEQNNKIYFIFLDPAVLNPEREREPQQSTSKQGSQSSQSELEEAGRKKRRIEGPPTFSGTTMTWSHLKK